MSKINVSIFWSLDNRKSSRNIFKNFSSALLVWSSYDKMFRIHLVPLLTPLNHTVKQKLFKEDFKEFSSFCFSTNQKHIYHRLRNVSLGMISGISWQLAEGDIGGLSTPQHRRKKTTNTASLQKKLTKHRHRNLIFVLLFKWSKKLLGKGKTSARDVIFFI